MSKSLARRPGAGLLCALLVLCAAGAQAAAGDAPRWSIQKPPRPAGFSDGRLIGVSCASSASCMAVGSFTNTRGVLLPLLERWNGDRWSVHPAPMPPRSAEAELFGISCPATTICVAVGRFSTKAYDDFPLVERWNGTRWKIQQAPKRGPLESFALYGVSCTSAKACTAVGSNGQDATLAEHWNGVKWSTQRTPDINGYSPYLGAVSCTSPKSCRAVGNYTDAETGCSVPLLERWNGTRWSLQLSPKLSGCGSDNVGLRDVSCPASTVCTTVGYEDTRLQRRGVTVSVGMPLVEHWSGTSWKFQRTPDITYLEDPWGGGGWLAGVSCTRKACTAVGAASSEILTRPLVESWNGRTWKVQRTPRVPVDGALIGISCRSATACTAVGYDDSQGAQTDVPLVESTHAPSRVPSAPTGGLG
jgi:hypothetical protein